MTTARVIERDVYILEQVRIVIATTTAHVFTQSYMGVYETALEDEAALEQLSRRLKRVVGPIPFKVVNPVAEQLRMSQLQKIGCLRRLWSSRLITPRYA